MADRRAAVWTEAVRPWHAGRHHQIAGIATRWIVPEGVQVAVTTPTRSAADIQVGNGDLAQETVKLPGDDLHMCAPRGNRVSTEGVVSDHIALGELLQVRDHFAGV